MSFSKTPTEESKRNIEKKLDEIARQMCELDLANKGDGQVNPVYTSLEKKYCSLFVSLNYKSKDSLKEEKLEEKINKISKEVDSFMSNCLDEIKLEKKDSEPIPFLKEYKGCFLEALKNERN